MADARPTLRRLANRVSVRNPETNKREWFGPEDRDLVPEWAQELITNPEAWEEVPDPDVTVITVKDNPNSAGYWNPVTRVQMVKILEWLGIDDHSGNKYDIGQRIQLHLLTSSGALDAGDADD